MSATVVPDFSRLGPRRTTLAFPIPRYVECYFERAKSELNALRFFGGVTEVLVPDNLRSGVKHACFYDPEINPTCHDFAEYHDTVVIPARKGHPRDKAKVENAVQQVERWVLAPVRNQQFFSIAEANRALQEPLQKLNGGRNTPAGDA